MSKSRERIAIRENGLSNSRERIAIRENELSNSRERITNPWERIAQFDINDLLMAFFWKSPCPFRAFVLGLYSFISSLIFEHTPGSLLPVYIFNVKKEVYIS